MTGSANCAVSPAFRFGLVFSLAFACAVFASEFIGSPGAARSEHASQPTRTPPTPTSSNAGWFHSAPLHVLHSLPVTRYWGTRRHPLTVNGRTMAPPVPKLYLSFDWMFHDVVHWTHRKGGECLAMHPLRDPAAACAAGREPASQIADPRTVWVQPSRETGDSNFAAALDALTRGRVPHEGDRVLVVAGEDIHLSQRLQNVSRLKPWFRRVYYEALDVQLAGVWPMPIGLTEFYYRAEGGQAAVLRAAREPAPAKPGDVLGAFGEWTPELTNTIESRRQASEFCSRRRGAAWLRCELVEQKDWYATLAGYRFLLCPTGNGVQSPKWLEALLAGVIPIAQAEPAFVSLRDSGWPMVVVESWEEVSSKASRDAWWAQLWPQLRALRNGGALSAEGYMRYLTADPARAPRADDLLG